MRPPDCYVCHLTLHEVPDDGRDFFTLVYFGATDDAKMAASRALEAVGRPGHLRNAIWFCNEDLPLGREHADRDLDEALAAIKADPRYLASRKGRPEGRVRPGTNGHWHLVPGQVLAALARALDVTASPRRAMAAAAALRGPAERATTRCGHRAGSARPRLGWSRYWVTVLRATPATWSANQPSVTRDSGC